MSRFNVKPIMSVDLPPRPPPKDMKPNAVLAMNSVHMVRPSYSEGPIDDEKPKFWEKSPHLTKAEKRKKKMAKAAAGVKGLMMLEPTKKMVEEYIASRIAELEAEDD